MTMSKNLSLAAETEDIDEFMTLVFPPSWYPVKARILETGVTFGPADGLWAARWTPVPLTVKEGRVPLEADLKSCIFRAHDCLHQLWGLPHFTDSFSEDEYYLFKRANMCGEVAVLTLVEFYLCRYWVQQDPSLIAYLKRRCALDMMDGPFSHLSMSQVAIRLDGILHKKLRPRWLRSHEPSKEFADHYVPMLEEDREVCDYRWDLMKTEGWVPTGMPNSRYSQDLDGLELTAWMISDFLHLQGTDDVVDWGLREFNVQRRSGLRLPKGWR